MRSVVVAAARAQDRRRLTDVLLQDARKRFTVRCADGAEAALAMLEAQEPDAVVVNAPLDDAFGDALAVEVSRGRACGVVLLARPEDLTDARIETLDGEGVIVLEKPFPAAQLIQSTLAAAATRARLAGLLQQNQRLRQEMDVIRLVSRAKGLLMHNLRMSEQQAHRFIEKQAMDRRVSRRAVAEGILRSYEP